MAASRNAVMSGPTACSARCKCLYGRRDAYVSGLMLETCSFCRNSFPASDSHQLLNTAVPYSDTAPQGEFDTNSAGAVGAVRTV